MRFKVKPKLGLFAVIVFLFGGNYSSMIASAYIRDPSSSEYF